MDHRPRTGVTGAVSASDLHLCEGVGPQDAGGGSWIADLVLWIDGGNVGGLIGANQTESFGMFMLFVMN